MRLYSADVVKLHTHLYITSICKNLWLLWCLMSWNDFEPIRAFKFDRLLVFLEVSHN